MTKGLISNQTVLVTGAAGFIGFHTCIKLIKDKTSVIGFDNLNNYYSQSLKKARLKHIKSGNNSNWNFFEISIENNKSLKMEMQNLL